MHLKKILFLDIETDSLDITKAKPKFVGCMKDNEDWKIFNLNEVSKKEVNDYLACFDKIITFNGERFDYPILENNGIKIEYWKRIDLYEVFKKRAVLLKSGGFKSYSLDNIIKEIGIKERAKKEIDYTIFQKDNWLIHEIDQIRDYLLEDLKMTKALWDFLVDKFRPFGEFVNDKDKSNFKHITSSTGAYAYKVICNMLNIKEEYDDIDGNDSYEGAFILKPQKEMAGNVLYLDFASLYPMLYVHANLFSFDCKCCKQDKKWHGSKMFKVDGYYCSKKQGKIEELIKNFYMKRKEYKKNKDNREFAIKIVLNSLYGISAKPSFKKLYSKYTASDCTGLARQCINYAIKKLNENGFNVIYADTDSCFVELGDKTKEECLRLSKEISKDISSNLPFSWDEFDFKLEDDIDFIQFFKDRSGELKKKNYIYINSKGKMTIKGLDIIKKDCSELGRYIFNEYLKEQILRMKDCLFSIEYIDMVIKEVIDKKGFKILSKRFNIKDDDYKSKTSIYNLIKEVYGNGEVLLIKNYKIGVGKGIKYCSLREAKELSIEDLNLEDTYKELSPFIDNFYEVKKQKKENSRKDKSQQTLF